MDWFSSMLSFLNAGVNTYNTLANYHNQQAMDEYNQALLQNNTMQGYQAQLINAINSYAEVMNQEATLTGAVRSNRLQIKQTNANISAYNQTQARMQSQFDYGLASIKNQGRGQYNALMAAYGNSSVANSARGQSRGSASLIEKMAKSAVIEYAGADMKLDAEGGFYGYALTDYFLDSLASHNEIQANKAIQEESFDIYYETLKKNMDNIERAKQIKDESIEMMQNAYDKLYAEYESKMSGAKAEYDAALNNYKAALEAHKNDSRDFTNTLDLSEAWEAYEKAYNEYSSANKNSPLAGIESITFLDEINAKPFETQYGDTDSVFNALKEENENIPQFTIPDTVLGLEIPEGSLGQEIIENVAYGMAAVGDFVSDAVENIGNGINTAIDAVGGFFADVGEGIANAAKDIWGWIKSW